MLELHRCVYCNRPVVVDEKGEKVFSLQCKHEVGIYFYRAPVPNTEAPMPTGTHINIPVNPVHPGHTAQAQWIVDEVTEMPIATFTED